VRYHVLCFVHNALSLTLSSFPSSRFWKHLRDIFLYYSLRIHLFINLINDVLIKFSQFGINSNKQILIREFFIKALVS